MPEVKLGLNDLNFGRSSAEETKSEITTGSLSSNDIHSKNIINTPAISNANTIKTDNIDANKISETDSDSMSKSPETTTNINTSSKCEAINLDDVKLHPCVDLTKFNAKGIIAFVPPEGSFELIR